MSRRSSNRSSKKKNKKSNKHSGANHRSADQSSKSRLGTQSAARKVQRIGHPAASSHQNATTAEHGSGGGLTGSSGASTSTAHAPEQAASDASSSAFPGGPSRLTAQQQQIVKAELQLAAALARAQSTHAATKAAAQREASALTALLTKLNEAAHPTTGVGFAFPLAQGRFVRPAGDLSEADRTWAHTTFKTTGSWATIKQNFGSDPERMAKLVAYRKLYVDGVIDKYRHEYPGLLARAAGSSDLTSDYDVTVAVAGKPALSVQLIERINQDLRGELGKEPGTVFDTNIYYKAVLLKDNLLADSRLPAAQKARLLEQIDGLEERPTPQPLTRSALEGYHRDQDVLSLAKQRRYMGDSEWAAYKAATLRQGSVGLRAETASRFDEAEHAVAAFQQESAAMLQQLGPAADGEDQRLRANNLLYVRKLQSVARAELEEMVLLRQLTDGAQSAAQREEAWRQLNEKRREIHRRRGESLYFAAEAYHSTGALEHVVHGVQGGGRVDAALELLLQSFNEQHGDFMKDVQHYSDDGELFYRSAKYAGRMGVAMKDYFMKANSITPQQLLQLLPAGITLEDLMSGTAQLGARDLQALRQVGIDPDLAFTFTPQQKLMYQQLEAMANNESRFLLAIRKGVSKASGPDTQDWYTRLTPDEKQFWAKRYVQMLSGAKSKQELAEQMMDLAASLNARARDHNASTWLQRMPTEPSGPELIQALEALAPPTAPQRAHVVREFPPRARGTR